jgi:polyhydroxyalkanoate synthesis regulator phasin
MTSNKVIVNHKIDEIAKTAKTKVEKVIDDLVEVASLAAEKAGQHMHDAGATVKDAGEKMMKLVD